MTDIPEPDPKLAKRDPRMTQLTSVAWIALTWNTIEHASEMMLGLALSLPMDLFANVASRLSFEDRADVIRHRYRVALLDGDSIYELVSDTLGAAATCKTHRDNIIHTRFDMDAMTGITPKRRGRTVRINMSPEGLARVHDYVDAVADEMVTAMHVTRCLAYGADANIPDSTRKQCEAEFPNHVAELRQYQKVRKAIPPLPAIEP